MSRADNLSSDYGGSGGGHCLCGAPLSGSRYGAGARLCWECRGTQAKAAKPKPEESKPEPEKASSFSERS